VTDARQVVSGGHTQHRRNLMTLRLAPRLARVARSVGDLGEQPLL